MLQQHTTFDRTLGACAVRLVHEEKIVDGGLWPMELDGVVCPLERESLAFGKLLVVVVYR